MLGQPFFGTKHLALLSICLMTIGCIERSTVIKVKSDGSGIVHIRQHEQKVSISFGGGAAKSEDVEEDRLPDELALQKMAEEMGDVELVSAKESVNRNGWAGYDLIFRFSNINDFVLPDDLVSPSSDDGDEAASALSDSDDAAIDVDETTTQKEGGYQFAMADGILEIRSLLPIEPQQQRADEQVIGAVDPFAEAPPAAEASIDLQQMAMEQVMAAALSDMRIGVFVQVDGELEATNAIHREGNLITLMRLNVGELLKDPDSKSHLSSLRRLKESDDRRRQLQQLSVEVDGLDIDAQDPIVVEFE
ncbi:MAG: hypothetical protein ACR2NZ_20615 [Rubripirellula sp.]